MSGEINRIAQTPPVTPLAQTTRHREGGVDGAISNALKQQVAAEGTFRDRSELQDRKSFSKEHRSSDKRPTFETQVTEVGGTLFIQERDEATGEIAFQFPTQAVVQGYAQQSKVPMDATLEGMGGQPTQLVDVKS
ncbi:MAG: hypothetical protein ACK5O7_04940 [Holosporales bacterium]